MEHEEREERAEREERDLYDRYDREVIENSTQKEIPIHSFLPPPFHLNVKPPEHVQASQSERSPSTCPCCVGSICQHTSR
jgi:hypothetical protein